jgi:nitroreductase
VPDTLDKRAETTFPIHDILAERWSPRAFADRAIPPDILGSLLEAARWAPSSRNLQPWRFVIAERHRNAEGFARILGTLMEGNQLWAQHASVLLIVAAKPTIDQSERANTYALYDVGQAVAHLSLQAMSVGLYIHQMGGFRRDLAREALAIPAGFDPVVSAAIGYLAAPSTLPQDVRERELDPRTRHPLSELVFSGLWGEGHPDYV